MQMSAAIAIACSTIARASSALCRTSARAAAIAIRAARSNPHHAVVRLDEIAGAREQIHHARVGDEQHRLEPAQRAIGAPVARQLDGRALEIAAMLFELALEPAEEREAIGRRAGKSREHPVVIQPPDLARLMFDDGLAERDLTVAGQHDLALVTDGKHGRGVGLGHGWREKRPGIAS